MPSRHHSTVDREPTPYPAALLESPEKSKDISDSVNEDDDDVVSEPARNELRLDGYCSQEPVTTNQQFVAPSDVQYSSSQPITRKRISLPTHSLPKRARPKRPSLQNPVMSNLDQYIAPLHKHHRLLVQHQYLPGGYKRLTQSEVTVDNLRQTGFLEPIVFPSFDAHANELLTLRRIATLIGYDCPLALVDVVTQRQIKNKMNMKEWIDYMSVTPQKRARIYDVLSLEVSTTKLKNYARKPDIVRDFDLINLVWPPCSYAMGDHPRVDTYCSMSAENAYTDFHVEFGGSCAYYDIAKGCKQFYLIPNSKKNLEIYENWLYSKDERTESFLPNLVDCCYRVEVHKNETIVIPSGWIYAVANLCDTTAISGNFLTSLHLKQELDVFDMEKRMGIKSYYQYPCFESIMWYSALYFYFSFPDEAPRDEIDIKLSVYETGALLPVESFTGQELEGFEHLLDFIFIQSQLLLTFEQPINTKGEYVDLPNQDYKTAYRMVPPVLDETCLSFTKKFGTWLSFHKHSEIELPKLTKNNYRDNKSQTRASRKGRRRRQQQQTLKLLLDNVSVKTNKAVLSRYKQHKVLLKKKQALLRLKERSQKKRDCFEFEESPEVIQLVNTEMNPDESSWEDSETRSFFFPSPSNGLGDNDFIELLNAYVDSESVPASNDQSKQSSIESRTVYDSLSVTFLPEQSSNNSFDTSQSIVSNDLFYDKDGSTTLVDVEAQLPTVQATDTLDLISFSDLKREMDLFPSMTETTLESNPNHMFILPKEEPTETLQPQPVSNENCLQLVLHSSSSFYKKYY
ncbi:jmjc domain chromatin associated protein Epe1 [Schizosaccharomyces japonicus yFS275]|uniref:[histone H3]-dimethyl-L-lysine(36) demethylase n=1 Tax=Schizosaccharomyces japonicus (strain yFS275 / FY16936) TaxID=402676 RepID=B6K4V0_SCHJY|nr:jmjc domain chromatin associated protein Epe1 [Schizosaccharomyces japonicus yFS275]EEB08507.1 jmjc domain chromatin associated protein Epe1 [Schizosaccharomyces japonicus yFS275]